MTQAYFNPDGDSFVPTPMAQGPWGQTISGMVVGGLLGHVLDRQASDPDMQPARLTVDLLRPVAMAAVTARSSVVRRGRRLELINAELVQGDKVVAMASALMLRRGEVPPGEVWSTAVDMPAPPPPDATTRSPVMWTYGRDRTTGTELDLTEWGYGGPKFVWMRYDDPLVDGEPMTALTRAAMAGDVSSSLTHYGTAGLHYINADYTVTLSRLPAGPDVGLAALTHSSAEGVAAGSAALFDRDGPIGAATVTALANPGFSPPFRG